MVTKRLAKLRSDNASADRGPVPIQEFFAWRSQKPTSGRHFPR